MTEEYPARKYYYTFKTIILSGLIPFQVPVSGIGAESVISEFNTLFGLLVMGIAVFHDFYRLAPYIRIVFSSVGIMLCPQKLLPDEDLKYSNTMRPKVKLVLTLI